MDWISELVQTFLTSLYGLRVPIAIGGAIAFVVLVLVARRRGWFAAARRHPGRAAALAIAVLAVGLPVGWYLGSPLLIRTSLEEPVPSALPSIAASGPEVLPTGTPVLSPDATVAPPADSGRMGQFTGADEFHFGSGTARLVESAPGTWVLRFEDFSVRNGPDLYVYLSPDADGYVDGATELGTLKATDGSFNYALPAGTDVEAIRSVVIWCKAFAVTFAVAPLS